MRAILITNSGTDYSLTLGEASIPTPQAGEVRIKVCCAGVNRPDLLQVLGKYKVPEDASPILGLEASGIVDATNSPDFKIGDRVCALTNGGGYADFVCVPASQTLPMPDTLSFEKAAALPEALFTVWQNMVVLGQFQKGKSVLIHGGNSGIGTIALQVAKALGASFVATTLRNPASIDLCASLGANQVIDTSKDDFEKTIKQPVDIVLDMMGGDYLEKNLNALAPYGYHVSIATLRGHAPPVPLWLVMSKNLTLTGSTLRPKTRAEKAALQQGIVTSLWPHIIAGKMKPVIDRVIPLADAQKALKTLEKGGLTGKIILSVQALT